jgi:hypothetical protein
MDKSKILGTALDVAKVAAPFVAGPAGVALGAAVLNMIRELKEVAEASPEEVAQFEATREEYERLVNERVDKTINALGDRAV